VFVLTQGLKTFPISRSLSSFVHMPEFGSTSASNRSGHRPSWTEIDLQALAANFHIVKERVGSGVNVMAVVKANAYGHGAVECARRLEAEGAEWFGVALPEEGIELRNTGIE
jgi:predicted amino acid racemase